jgi:toxin-antitoxin system PIN domain toxin
VSRVALLDVNLLVALFDPEHVHHDIAHDWFVDHRVNGWATCAITENGLVRVLSTPSYRSGPVRSADALDRLREFCDSADHTFWDRSVSLRDGRIFNAAALSGYRQLTDIYLLGLAKTMDGVFVTLDRTIPLRAVVGAGGDDVAVIAPADE